jgi:hypothetical protein
VILEKVNERMLGILIQKPKITKVLQEMEGFTFA